MTPARGTLLFYGHNTRECGNEIPDKKVTINVKLDVRTAGGSTTVKQRMDGQLAWLMEEGMELPVIVDDATGLATSVDTDALAAELSHEGDAVRAQEKEQSSLRYSAGIPSRQELSDAKDIAGEVKDLSVKGLRGLARRLRRSS